MENIHELYTKLYAEGYSDLRHIEGRGTCGLLRMAFTIALVYGIDEYSYQGRYCYPNRKTAFTALLAWDGKGDPQDSDWIKHKARGVDATNPKRET